MIWNPVAAIRGIGPHWGHTALVVGMGALVVGMGALPHQKSALPHQNGTLEPQSGANIPTALMIPFFVGPKEHAWLNL